MQRYLTLLLFFLFLITVPCAVEGQRVGTNVSIGEQTNLGRAGEEIELTKKEYDLLVYLIRNEGIVVSRDKLLNNVWGYDYTGETNIVDVYIRYLRSKIDDPFNQKLIHTVRGVGYVLRSDKNV